MPEQEQFLQVLDRDEAEHRFRAALDLTPRGVERIPLDAALGRVLAADVLAPVDVPSFDRSNVDGFAVVAEDTFGASEEAPRVISLIDEHIHTGIVPGTAIHAGEAAAIATGGMMPRGADAVVMVEHADARRGVLRIARAVTAGSGVSFAGTDITAGETVLRQGQLLTSRDTGVLAAIGVADSRCLAQAGRRHSVHGRRDHRAGRSDAAGPRLRLQRAGAGRCRPRGSAASRRGSGSSRTMSTTLRERLRAGARVCRPGAALRRDE